MKGKEDKTKFPEKGLLEGLTSLEAKEMIKNGKKLC
jgi:hypothetical protein